MAICVDGGQQKTLSAMLKQIHEYDFRQALELLDQSENFTKLL